MEKYGNLANSLQYKIEQNTSRQISFIKRRNIKQR